MPYASGIDAAAIRRRFLEERHWEPVQAGDRAGTASSRPLRHAAVLIPLVTRTSGLTVLLTRRTDHLHDHAGQISFPGGRVEPEDAGATGTALRETAEEIGLRGDCIELLGTVGTYVTATGYHVTPVAALVHPPFELAPDPSEVAEVFEVPLSFILDSRNHQRNTVVTREGRRQYHAIPYGSFYIWGATAAMLLNFRAYLHAPGVSQQP
jgi:8-oxo-dGTP pyrophosphatase MutT (NUDIX family)